MKIFKKMKKGFTLVELVVVIAVIAILAAVSVGAYFGVTDSANASKLEQEAKQVHTAIQTVALAPNEHSSLTSSGLTITDEEEFEDKLIETLGHDVYLTNVEKETVDSMPTIYFSSAEYSARVENGFYKSFEYYIPGITNKKASVDVVTGKCSIVAAGETSVVDPDEGKVWYLVNDARTLSVGDKIVIAAKDYNLALSNAFNENNISALEIVKEDNFLSINENTQIIKLENGSVDGTFAFNVGENSYLYGGLASNHLKVKNTVDANSSWDIFISKGAASIVSQGSGDRNTLRFNENIQGESSNPIFSCYGSGQNDVSIYKFGFYEETPCNHIFEETEPECLICGEPNLNYVEPTPEVIDTISVALNANDNSPVELTGTVVEMYREWSDSYGNNSFYISDGQDRILVFNSTTKVNIADQVSLTGVIGHYHGVAQVNDSTVTITVPHECLEFTEGSCYEPKCCVICDKPYGDPLGHTEPNDEGKCDRCGTTVGNPVFTLEVSIADYAVSHNWSNDTKYEKLDLDSNIEVTCSGTDSNTGKYYSSGQNWRMYQSGNPQIVVTGKNNSNIISVAFKYVFENAGILTQSSSNVNSEEVVIVNGSSITFGVGNTTTATNGQVRITSITVVYSADPNHLPHVHEYVATVTEPTCKEGGYTTYRCECGDSYIADEVPAIDHSYVDNVCEHCGAEKDDSTVYEVLYTVSSTSLVTTSGFTVQGSEATYSSTYGTKEQLTKDNSMTLSISGFSGKTITGITLSMKSNSKGGRGSYLCTVGNTTISSITDSAFNSSNWYGAWSTSYVNITPSVEETTVGDGENVEIKITASANSLYCNSFKIYYKA